MSRKAKAFPAHLGQQQTVLGLLDVHGLRALDTVVHAFHEAAALHKDATAVLVFEALWRTALALAVSGVLETTAAVGGGRALLLVGGMRSEFSSRLPSVARFPAGGRHTAAAADK